MMKKIVFLLLLSFNIASFSQQANKITPKKCIPKKGFHLKLKSVFDDSRCPEGVTCVWAGEVSVIIEVYKDQQLMEEKKLTLNSKNKEENIKWLVNYLPESAKNVKSIFVLPYPKEGIAVKPKQQFVAITYND
jgi:hypothetical protein